MISSFLASDMKSALSFLEFYVKGVSMEKMGWFRADALPFIIRPQLPQKRFVAFSPDPAGQAAGFTDGIFAFYRDIGFDFCHFQVFFGKSEAGRHPNYGRLLNPLGIRAEQRICLPEITYCFGLQTVKPNPLGLGYKFLL